MRWRLGVKTEAKIAQLGERMTEDHKVRCSIHLLGAFFFFELYLILFCCKAQSFAAATRPLEWSLLCRNSRRMVHSCSDDADC